METVGDWIARIIAAAVAFIGIWLIVGLAQFGHSNVAAGVGAFLIGFAWLLGYSDGNSRGFRKGLEKGREIWRR